MVLAVLTAMCHSRAGGGIAERGNGYLGAPSNKSTIVPPDLNVGISPSSTKPLVENQGLGSSNLSGRANNSQVIPGGQVTSAQWVIEILEPSMCAGVFQCSVSRGRVVSFLATVSNWACVTAARSTPLG